MIKTLSLTAGILSLLLATGAYAQDKPSAATDDSQKTPAEINQEVIENTKKMPDGTVQAETGRAKPVENWFGCKPGNDKEACEAEQKKKSSASADSNATKSTQ